MLHSCIPPRNAWANLYITGRPNRFLARRVVPYVSLGMGYRRNSGQFVMGLASFGLDIDIRCDIL